MVLFNTTLLRLRDLSHELYTLVCTHTFTLPVHEEKQNACIKTKPTIVSIVYIQNNDDKQFRFDIYEYKHKTKNKIHTT